MADANKFEFSGDLASPGGTKASAGSESGTSGSINETGRNTDAAGQSGIAPESLVRKTRGRKPFPRDASGNIIRPAESAALGSAQGKAKGTGTKSENLAVAFKPNDRADVLNNIQGIHTILAVATKQPVFILNAQEAQGLTKALCDVLDYHKINITDATGPWGLYAALALTAYTIYKPKIDYLKQAKAGKVESVARPATPMEAEIIPSGGMDFSGDISTVN